METKCHDFHESLKLSHEYADAPWWEEVYREAFHNFNSMADMRGNVQGQRDGIDRFVNLNNGETLKVDEKVREKSYPDILLEIWANKKERIKGWAIKDLRCDYIAYAFIPTKTCYLLPFLQLRKALKVHGAAWWAKGQKNQEGFHVAIAKNEYYNTHSICVPIDILLSAIGQAMVVSWTKGETKLIKSPQDT